MDHRAEGNAEDSAGFARVTRWMLIGAGIAVGIAYLTIRFTPDTTDTPRPSAFAMRLALPLIGVLLAAGAVVRNPKSVAVLTLASLTGSIAAMALVEQWDTLRLVVVIASSLAAVAALVMLLPASWRRLVVSLLILLHFGGILTAVTTVPPPGANAPWLTMQVWTRFYRPYLQFVYLNNAYHFYAPEPGPATLLWFQIAYENGSVCWEVVPDRKAHAKDPLMIEYYRRLSLTENVNQLAPVPFVPPEVQQRRLLGSIATGIPSPEEFVPFFPGVGQYRPPAPNARRFLESYVRHVAESYARPESNIKGIKVYRVVHSIVQPGEFARGLDPRDPTLYAPFFLGEFDVTGNLKDPNDPFLYWLIPIVDMDQPARFVKGTAGSSQPSATASAERRIRDYLRVHAGSSPLEENR